MTVAWIRGSAFSRADLLRAAADAALALPSEGTPTSEVRAPVMAGTVAAARIRPGLLLAAHELEYLDQGVFETPVEPGLICGLLLDGESEPLEIDGHPPIRHEPGRLTIAGFGETTACRRAYRKNQRNRAFALTIGPEFLDRFEDAAADSGLTMLRDLLRPGLTVRHFPAPSSLLSLARQSLDHGYAGPLSELFLESLALRFTVEVAHLLGQESRLIDVLGARRYKQVCHARDLLDRTLTNPPALLDLARVIGTNVPALQAGFRKAFGTTVFGYVRDQRLAIARVLILDDGIGIAEAGYRVGFTNAAAFTAAYRRKFGEPPSADRVRRVDN